MCNGPSVASDGSEKKPHCVFDPATDAWDLNECAMNLCAASGCGWGEFLSAGSSSSCLPVVEDGKTLVRAELPVTASCHGSMPPAELLDSGSFDLFGASLLFKESRETCAEQHGGGLDELGDATFLYLGDDASSGVVLETFVFPFAGNNHTSVCVSSNGYLELSGDCSSDSSDPYVSFSSHFAHPSIAAFRSDLDPSAGGDVLVREIPGEMLTVQFNGVPIYDSSSTVSFQIDLFANGDVRLTYGAGDPAATSDVSALVGLSVGTSPLEWYQGIDLSQSSPCGEEAEEV